MKRGAPQWLDWRIALVLVVIAASFIAILAFPEVVPFTYLWAAAVSTAAFARPTTTLAIGLLASGLAILGYVLTDNAHGPIFWLRVIGFFVLVGVSYVIALRRSRGEELLRQQATTDALTGLPNRRLLIERLQAQLLLQVRGTRSPSAVIYADLDDFKAINDRHGHSVGDEVLVHVSERLVGCMHAADTLARFGGDEFVIAIPVADSRAEIDELCERMREAIARPFEIHGMKVSTGISLGVAISRGDQLSDPTDLIDAADRALRDCKAESKGGRRVVDYQPAGVSRA